MVRHGTALSIRGRGHAVHELFHQLDPDEVQRRRAYISCRRGGRAEFRRQLLDQQFGAAARRPSRVSAGRGRGVGWQPPVPGTSAMPCPLAMEDDDNDVSTTWVTANLPELTDPTALEISALCMAVPTAEASVQTERTLSVRSVGVVVVGVMRPPRPIPSSFQLGRTQGPCQCRGCRRRMSQPRISRPPWSTSLRRGRTFRRTSSAKSCAPDSLATPFRRTGHCSWPSTSTSTQMAQRLLDRMAHHFGHLTHVEPSAIVAFLADQLGEWKRRPSLIRHGAARNLYRPRH